MKCFWKNNSKYLIIRKVCVSLWRVIKMHRTNDMVLTKSMCFVQGLGFCFICFYFYANKTFVGISLEKFTVLSRGETHMP